jgi:hypothetical protein
MTMSSASAPRAASPRASTALRVKLGLAAPALRTASAALWRPAGLRRRYVEYLYAMHALIRASVPLLERAALRCAELPPADRLAEPLRRYFEEHAAEERGHDAWLLGDLAAAGADPSDTLSRLPAPVVAELAGAQYYWVDHHHPVMLLGYVLVLEDNAPAPWLAERLADLTGLPRAAFRTVRDHAGLDTGHVTALEDLLDALPLTPAQEAAVAVSALRTSDGVTCLFRQLAARTEGF